jgi:membrane associated rhomboid family serine protease
MDIRNLPDEALSAEAVKRDRRRMENALLLAGVAVAVLWFFELFQRVAGERFDWFALSPREALGLIGIVGAPLIHGSLEHLATNSFPTFALLALGFYAVPRASFRALPLIWVVSGVLVWLFGRESLHVGASGLTHGLMSFLLLLGALRRDRTTISISMVVFFLYGSMLYGFLPHEPGVSFEYHGAGLLSGVLAAILYRKLDPLPPVRRYSWEEEAESESEFESDPLEPPSPKDVHALWDDPSRARRGVVIEFPKSTERQTDSTPPKRTLH